jgi:hypothetical protein
MTKGCGIGITLRDVIYVTRAQILLKHLFTSCGFTRLLWQWLIQLYFTVLITLCDRGLSKQCGFVLFD